MNEALSGLAKEAKTIRFEQSENQRLETLVGNTWAYNKSKTTALGALILGY